MSVYIDNMNYPYGRMQMCHMVADSTDELLEMADSIGVNRKHIQYFGEGKEHFDICLSKKKKAIKNGAIEVSYRKLATATIKRKSPNEKL